MKTTKKTVKGWAVVWTLEAREPYGVEDNDALITAEPKEEIKYNINRSLGRPSYRYTSLSAVFPTKEEAEAYRAQNTDWVSVPVTLTYSLPLKKSV